MTAIRRAFLAGRQAQNTPTDNSSGWRALSTAIALVCLIGNILMLCR